MSYWIFQGNPNKYDVSAYLQKYDYVYWGLKQHKDKMAVDDVVYFWRAKGGTTNPYGLVTKGVIKEPQVSRNQVKYPNCMGNEFWKGDFEVFQLVAGVQIIETRLSQEEGMLSSDILREDNLLKELTILKVGQGTNFSITDQEGKQIDKLWDQIFSDTSTGNSDWTIEEVKSIVDDYFSMLSDELSNNPYNKSEHNRSLRELLSNRSRGSIEFKHANISAVLIELGFPYIDGYKPRYNYQSSLFEFIQDYLESNQEFINQALLVENDDPTPQYKPDESILNSRTDPPKQSLPKKKQIHWKNKKGTKKNYQDVEGKNEKLGIDGEKFIVDHEKVRLKVAGRSDLAEKVEHVSQTKGDGLGYDVLSFNEDGSEMWIEVKTTRSGKFYPFLISQNEVQCSIDNPQEFYLYRVFNFRKDPKFYVLHGSLEELCELVPTTFNAYVKGAIEK